MLSLRSRVQAASGQVSCEVADETVLLSLPSGTYHGLDPVGSRIWQLLQQPTSVAQVREALLREYDVDPVRCERDLLGLLARLSDAGLIEVRGAQDP